MTDFLTFVRTQGLIGCLSFTWRNETAKEDLSPSGYNTARSKFTAMRRKQLLHWECCDHVGFH